MNTTSFPKKARKRKRPRKRPKPPEPDWQHLSCTDLRQEDEFPGTCDLCNRSGIRFLHLIEDQNSGETMAVGCCCGEKLVTEFDGKRIERKLLSLRKKREEFPYRKSWKLSRKGNPRLVTKDYSVTIYPDNYDPDVFSYCVVDKDDDRETYFGNGFLSPNDAKRGAYDCLADVKGWGEP